MPYKDTIASVKDTLAAAREVLTLAAIILVAVILMLFPRMLAKRAKELGDEFTKAGVKGEMTVGLPGFNYKPDLSNVPPKEVPPPSTTSQHAAPTDPAPELVGRWIGTVTLLGTTAVQPLSMSIKPAGFAADAGLSVELLSKGDSVASLTWKVSYHNGELVFLQGNENKCENRVKLRLTRPNELTGTSSPADDTQSIDPGCDHKTYNQQDNYYYTFRKL